MKLLLIVVLAFGSVTAVAAQDTPKIQPTVDAQTVAVRYGNEVFELNPADSGVAIGYVDERNESIDGVTLVIILFVHDDHGWRAAGKLEGSATGDLAGAGVGDVLTLQILGN